MKVRILIFLLVIFLLSACDSPAKLIRRLTYCPMVSLSDLHWLSDSELVYVYPAVNGDVYKVDTTSDENSLLVALADADRWGFQWSLDGDYFLFNEGFTWVIMDTGGNTHNILSTSDVDYDPTWSPDASQIAYISNADSIYTIRRDGSERTLIFSGSETSWALYRIIWSPDGEYIAASGTEISVGTEQNTSILLIMKPDGSDLRQYPSEAFQWMRWSPDSRWLAGWYHREDLDHSATAMIDAASGEVHTLATEGENFLDWLADSSGVYARLPDTDQLVALHLDGTSEIIGEMQSWLRISPDKSKIAYVRGQSPTDPAPDIYIANLDGSDARIVFHNPAPSVCFNP